MAMQNLQQIFADPLWTLLIGIVATLVFSIVIYHKSKRLRKPTYFIRSTNLVTGFSKKLDKLQLLYDNNSIETITVSKIAFWNDGAETVEESNIVEAGDDCDILDAHFVQENDAAKKFSVALVSSKLAGIRFESLDKGEGGVIQLIPTGKDSSDIRISGFIKDPGTPKASYTTDLFSRIIRRLSSSPPKKDNPRKQRRIIGAFFLIYAVLMTIPVATEGRPTDLIVDLVFISALLYFGYYMLRRRVPKGLEIVVVEEEI
ncbi:MAG: hypothetical protein QGI51_05715 [Dehalococcoidales bacterium]|nr:hypothetical protein [Dehalococcoidales bacterium]MDP6632982.1 hypothetical protein [Dehalococcoidales bacterium]